MSNANTDTQSNTILSVNNLFLKIGKKKVLDHVNVSFEKGQAVLIAGNNGSGKSSLLRCIAGIYLPDSGSIRFDNSITKKKIGFISDKMSLFEHFTLQEGIDFHCKVFGVDSYDDSLLKPVNLSRKQKIKELSNGERALFNLSLLMSQKPEILMIDEIIHIIDPYLRELFLEAAIDLIDSFNTTVIMVNHTFSDMGRIPERVLILEDGSFILDEKTDELTGKVRKIITDKEIDLDIPVILKKESPVHNEYYIYPYTPELKSSSNYEFIEVDLAEIIKSFIGGYYAKKRSK
jgi:ABC-2 type transport system ATP-binding protein